MNEEARQTYVRTKKKIEAWNFKSIMIGLIWIKMHLMDLYGRDHKKVNSHKWKLFSILFAFQELVDTTT